VVNHGVSSAARNTVANTSIQRGAKQKTHAIIMEIAVRKKRDSKKKSFVRAVARRIVPNGIKEA